MSQDNRNKNTRPQMSGFDSLSKHAFRPAPPVSLVPGADHSPPLPPPRGVAPKYHPPLVLPKQATVTFEQLVVDDMNDLQHAAGDGLMTSTVHYRCQMPGGGDAATGQCHVRQTAGGALVEGPAERYGAPEGLRADQFNAAVEQYFNSTFGKAGAPTQGSGGFRRVPDEVIFTGTKTGKYNRPKVVYVDLTDITDITDITD
jgi:hypothetical protein